MKREIAEPQVELLAPAGCYASLQAAIDAGADAVYFGLVQLNMRARARKSFDLGDLPVIMDRCREGGVRGYLALNTILYDHDLELCYQLLEMAKAHGVDAIIAADMACILKARELGLEVHLSTQLSVSNFQSLEFYAQFCDRVVLARELSLAMIRRIRRQIVEKQLLGPGGRIFEIEVFAHGALCIAVSGRCGMSLYNDNASSNRGACLQPCRREYIVKDAETGKELKIDNNFVFSPSDISTIDFLDEVINAGACALKIEGRGRAPEYVKVVVRAYRQALQAIAEGRYTRELAASLVDDLKAVYNRGFSDGYYLGRPQGWSRKYGSKATRQKLYRGQVTRYYPRIGVAEVKATGNVVIGDSFVVIGETSGAVEGRIEELRLDAGAVAEVGRGEVFAFKIDERVRVNDRFYILAPAAPESSESD